MFSNIIRNTILLLVMIAHTSCSQKQDAAQNKEADQGSLSTSQEETPIKALRAEPHNYGGWSCPDNLRAFPPVNLTEIDKIPAVNDRLPTKEETENGISLLYFDIEEFPDARPINMPMPKLARYYSEYTKKNELVIVIQVVEVDQDTVVGFRYLNGGNGSAWFNEVSFLSDDEAEQIGPTPFVFETIQIGASKENVWHAITNQKHDDKLGKTFAKDAVWESDLRDYAEIQFKGDAGETVRTGLVSALWGNLYIQIDYNNNGQHSVEKLLLLQNQETKKTELYLVAGPYGSDYDDNREAWLDWLSKINTLSEAF